MRRRKDGMSDFERAQIDAYVAWSKRSAEWIEEARRVFPGLTDQRFSYDARHLMIAETNQRGFTTEREYDAAGRLVVPVRIGRVAIFSVGDQGFNVAQHRAHFRCRRPDRIGAVAII